MATVAKVSSKSIKNEAPQDLAKRIAENKAALEANPGDKTAQSNLRTINKEFGKDLGISAKSVEQLTGDQLLKIVNAKNNLKDTVDVGTLPPDVSKDIQKSLTKNISKAEKQDTSKLASAQKAEIRALQDKGADKATIAAAKADNARELADAKSRYKEAGYQKLSDANYNKAGQVVSGNEAYINTPQGQEADALLKSGYELMQQLGLAQNYKSGKTSIGFNPYTIALAAADRDPTTGEFKIGENIKTAAYDYSGRAEKFLVTRLNEIAKDAANPQLSEKAKPISTAYNEQGQPIGTLYQDIAHSYKKGNTYDFFLQTPDGQLKYIGANVSFTPTGGGGFFSSPFGRILVGLAGAAAVGPLASTLAGGAATAGSTIAAGALTGGLGSAITGGDILKGAALGGVGGAFNVRVADSIGSNMVNSISNSLSSSLGPELANVVARSATSAALGAIQSGIVGTDALTGAGLSLLGSAVQSSVSNELSKLNLPPQLSNLVANAASNAAANGVVAAVQGQDVGLAVGSALAETGFQTVGEIAFSGKPTTPPTQVAEAPSGTLPPGYWSMTAGLDTGPISDVQRSVAEETAAAYRGAGAQAGVEDGSVVVTAPRLPEQQLYGQMSMLPPIPDATGRVPSIPTPSTQDILRQAGITGAASTPAATTTPSTAPGVAPTPAPSPSGVAGGGMAGGVPTGVPGGMAGGAGTAAGAGQRPAEMAPPVDVTAQRPAEMAPPVDVTAPREEMAPPVDVTEKPEPVYDVAEGKTTYFGPPPAPPSPDLTLTTFLGLTPLPAQATQQAVQRGSPPTMFTGSEESDLSALFGGKPEELQDVWNQASLRLRSALGI